MFELRIHSKACLGDKNEKQKRSTYCMHGAEARDATGSVCGSSRSSGIVSTGGVGANRLRRASACGNGDVILPWMSCSGISLLRDLFAGNGGAWESRRGMVQRGWQPSRWKQLYWLRC